MTKHIRTKKARRKDWHRADIKAALEKAGWTLRRLSVHSGYAATMAQQALGKPYFNAEQIIAAALGIEPWEIWPSRYDENHHHIRQLTNFPVRRPTHWAKPGRTSSAKSNTPAESGNVNPREAE